MRAEAVELVLPNGIFACIRPPTVRDVSVAGQVPPELFMAVLIALTVTLDCEPVTVEQVLDMDYGDMLPVYEVIVKRMKMAAKTKDGVA